MKKRYLILSVIFLLFFAASPIMSIGAQKPTIAAKENKLVKANSQFAFDIFKQLNLKDKDKNIFISPYSISEALAMAYNGAGTSTKKEMEKVLGFGTMSKEQVNKEFKTLNDLLTANSKNGQLNIGNSVWIRNNFKIKSKFIKLNQDTFKAKISVLDFSKNSAAGTINAWVSEITKKKINEIVCPPIYENTVMYLINAIYFKGSWTIPFDRAYTNDFTFKSGNGKEKRVKMMWKNNGEFGRGKDCTVVRLPYGKGDVAMYCILPDKSNNINDFIKSLDLKKWKEIKNSITGNGKLILRLPRFKIEYGSKSLKECLSSMGMMNSFKQRKADFNAIAPGLFIDDALHKALIEVNEEGTEAAAATTVGLNDISVTPEFCADRPFFFVIADDKTGTILFMGKVYDI